MGKVTDIIQGIKDAKDAKNLEKYNEETIKDGIEYFYRQNVGLQTTLTQREFAYSKTVLNKEGTIVQETYKNDQGGIVQTTLGDS